MPFGTNITLFWDEITTFAAKKNTTAMLPIKITVMRKCHHADLSALYENPIEHACDMEEGATYVSLNAEKPDGLCASAWLSLQPYVMALAHGAENFYDGWMKNPKSAMVSCNDGFRPVSFLVEVE